MTPLQRFLIDQIRDEMERQGVSQVELARRSGYTQKTVSQVVNGNSGSLHSFGALVDALHIDIPAAFEERP